MRCNNRKNFVERFLVSFAPVKWRHIKAKFLRKFETFQGQKRKPTLVRGFHKEPHN